jgi:virulence-associated protein VagC
METFRYSMAGMLRFPAYLLLCAGLATALHAQTRPEALIKKAETAPLIDGNADAVWDLAEAHPIDRDYQNETPSIGNSTWQMLWSDEGLYVLLVIEDDDFYPSYETGGPIWEYDVPELYFDVNEVLEDNQGASAGPESGHYQINPAFREDFIDGTLLDDPLDIGIRYAHLVNDPDYTAEYFIPFSYLRDKEGNQVILTNDIGFDVQIIDRDEGDQSRNRAVWANSGTSGDFDESWNSMDECGIIRLEGAPQPIIIDSLVIDGGAITENNGQLVIEPHVWPADAWEGELNWTVENVTGRARVDHGTVTGIVDGTAIVKVASRQAEDTALVVISSQIVSLPELNLIRNGYFDEVTGLGTAAEWSGYYTVVDGTLYLPSPGIQQANPWDGPWTRQTGFGCNDHDPYLFSFVLTAEAPDTFHVVFDDPVNDYIRYGTSDHEYSLYGESEWQFVTSTESRRYAFDVTFDRMFANAEETLNLMGGLHNAGGLFIDSVVLVNTHDLSLITDYKPVESIVVSAQGGDTVVDIGSVVQCTAEVLPADADFTEVRWGVEPVSGKASISESGLLTADTTGIVIVTASAVDDSKVMGSLEITVAECSLYEIGMDVVVTPATCNGKSDGALEVSLDGYEGDLVYSWSSGQDTNRIENLFSGQYTLTITEPGNCSRVEVFEVGDSLVLEPVSLDLLPPACAGDSNGLVYLEVAGGFPPYLVEVNGNACDIGQGYSCGSLKAGPVSIVVTDTMGCYMELETRMEEPAPVQIDLQPSETLCYGDSSGAVEATVTGGTGGYAYQWNTGYTGEDPVGIPAGKYILSVEDAHGCHASDSTVIPGFDRVVTGDIGGLRNVEVSEVALYAVTSKEGSQYQWSASGGNVMAGQFTNVIAVHWITPGTGQVNVSEWDAHGCRGEAVSLTVEILGSGSAVTGDIGGLQNVEEMEVAFYAVKANDQSLYQWSALGGNVLEGQNTNVASVQWTQAGLGYVYVAEQNAQGQWEDTMSLEVNIKSLGLEEQDAPGGVTLYPNPSSGYLYIMVPAGQGATTVQVINIQGRILREVTVQPGKEARLHVLDLQGIEPGILFIKLTGKDRTSTRKAVLE